MQFKIYAIPNLGASGGGGGSVAGDQNGKEKNLRVSTVLY